MQVLGYVSIQTSALRIFYIHRHLQYPSSDFTIGEACSSGATHADVRSSTSRFDQALTLNAVATTSYMTPAPSTPKSQSEAARKLRDVETKIGSVVDLVTQSPKSSGMSDFCPCSHGRLLTSARLLFRHSDTQDPFARMYPNGQHCTFSDSNSLQRQRQTIPQSSHHQIRRNPSSDFFYSLTLSQSRV